MYEDSKPRFLAPQRILASAFSHADFLLPQLNIAACASRNAFGSGAEVKSGAGRFMNNVAFVSQRVKIVF